MFLIMVLIISGVIIQFRILIYLKMEKLRLIIRIIKITILFLNYK